MRLTTIPFKLRAFLSKRTGSQAERRGKLVPPRPPGFQSDPLWSGVTWHQRWEVFTDLFLPGRNDVLEILEYIGLRQT